MNSLTQRNELTQHQHSPGQVLDLFSGHQGHHLLHSKSLNLVNVCGGIPCNRKWLLKPSSSPHHWFFWPAETQIIVCYSVDEGQRKMSMILIQVIIVQFITRIHYTQMFLFVRVSFCLCVLPSVFLFVCKYICLCGSPSLNVRLCMCLHLCACGVVYFNLCEGLLLFLYMCTCMRDSIYLQLLVLGEAELLQQHRDVGEVQTEERVFPSTSLHVLTHCTLNAHSSSTNTHFTL